MLSQTAEYALRAMVSLATALGKPRTAQELAADSKVPLDYLSKILNALTRAGVVTSQRGRGGGFQTVQPLTKLTVLEVVSAVDPIKRIKACPLGLKAHSAQLCPLHSKLDEAARSVEQTFSSVTIQSLVGESFCEGGQCDAAA